MKKVLSPSFVKLLHEVCENADGYSIRSYSGRFMYGKNCFAIVCEQGGSPSDFWALAIDACVELAKFNDYESDELVTLRDLLADLSTLMHGIREDSMGLGRVFYNPNIAWRDEYDPDYEEPSEDDETPKETEDEERARFASYDAEEAAEEDESDEEGDGSEDEKNAPETTLEPAT